MKRILILLMAGILSFSVSAQTDSTHRPFMAGINVFNLSFSTPTTSPIVRDLDTWQVINYDQDFTPNALAGVNFKWNLDKNVWLNVGVNWIYNSVYYYRAVTPYNKPGGFDTTIITGRSRGVLIYAGVSERYGKGKIKLVPEINWEIFSANENAYISTADYAGPFSYNTFGLGLNPVLGVELDLGRFSIMPQTGVNLLFIQSGYSYPYNPNYGPFIATDESAGFRLTWDVISQIAVDYRF